MFCRLIKSGIFKLGLLNSIFDAEMFLLLQEVLFIKNILILDLLKCEITIIETVSQILAIIGNIQPVGEDPL